MYGTDGQDVLDSLTTMARVLVDIGCPEGAVKATLAEAHPGADVDAAYEEALLTYLAREVEAALVRRRVTPAHAAAV